MKKFSILLCLVLASSLMFSGCTPTTEPIDPTVNETIQLFYGDSNNTIILTEDRDISYLPTDDKYKLAVEELISGPTIPNATSNIDPQTVVYGTTIQNDYIIVNLSNHFAMFSGSMGELMAVAGVVNTLTQFPEITKAKILVEGAELIGPSGDPRGFMDSFPLDPNSTTTIPVILYFSDSNAMGVVAETRDLTVDGSITNEDLIKKVVEELIAGPNNMNLSKTIPAEVTVNSVTIVDQIAYIDFSAEMHTKHWGGATGEGMTYNSLLNTLTEFDYIDQALFTVDGSALAIEHMIMEEPMGRNEAAIIK